MLIDREEPKKARKYPRSTSKTKLPASGRVAEYARTLKAASLNDPRSFTQGELPLGQFKAVGNLSASSSGIKKSASGPVIETPPSEKTRHRKSSVPELKKGRDGLYPTIYRDKRNCGPAFRFNWEIECEKVVVFIDKLQARGIPVLYMYNTRRGERNRTKHHYISIDGRGIRKQPFLSDAKYSSTAHTG